MSNSRPTIVTRCEQELYIVQGRMDIAYGTGGHIRGILHCLFSQ